MSVIVMYRQSTGTAVRIKCKGNYIDLRRQFPSESWVAWEWEDNITPDKSFEIRFTKL